MGAKDFRIATSAGLEPRTGSYWPKSKTATIASVGPFHQIGCHARLKPAQPTLLTATLQVWLVGRQRDTDTAIELHHGLPAGPYGGGLQAFNWFGSGFCQDCPIVCSIQLRLADGRRTHAQWVKQLRRRSTKRVQAGSLPRLAPLTTDSTRLWPYHLVTIAWVVPMEVAQASLAAGTPHILSTSPGASRCEFGLC
ncbi:hypothetical protein CPLU01_00740 [Colletotrichum plurivorum]|uniref:Uncharacterized protein n=1 Tax=Colletotrichum plurivorum TaxID=2175906 RepID=A0A8H6NRM2_9PEZI|nr:hypothetical protein CPLU01_00740 [Colletotrichum plurivorum]